MLSLVLLGLLLGIRHATDPDHLVAVATVVGRKPTWAGAAGIGALWGLGHTLTLMVVGGGIIVFRWVIPARLGLTFELAIAVMLIILGLVALRGAPRAAPGAARPLLIGVVHGLAGSAAVALLVLATIRSPSWAILYLLLFCLGTVAGMMLMTSAMALPFRSGGHRMAGFPTVLRYSSGVLSVGFGLFLAWQAGVSGGLFTAHPVWTPR